MTRSRQWFLLNLIAICLASFLGTLALLLSLADAAGPTYSVSKSCTTSESALAAKPLTSVLVVADCANTVDVLVGNGGAAEDPVFPLSACGSLSFPTDNANRLWCKTASSTGTLYIFGTP